MPISFRCHECQASLTVPNANAGRKGKCPKCSAAVTAPLIPEIPAPELVWKSAVEYEEELLGRIREAIAEQKKKRRKKRKTGADAAVKEATSDSEMDSEDVATLASQSATDSQESDNEESAVESAESGNGRRATRRQRSATKVADGEAADDAESRRKTKKSKGTKAWGAPPETRSGDDRATDAEAAEALRASEAPTPPAGSQAVTRRTERADLDSEDTEHYVTESARGRQDPIPREVVSGPRVTVASAGHLQGMVYALEKRCTVIGRDSSNEIAIASGAISRHHCQLEKAGDEFVLTDLGSSNGTIVNGEHTVSQALRAGDYIQVGDVLLRFDDD